MCTILKFKVKLLIIKRSNLYYLLVAVIAAFFYSLWQRSAHVDDAWIGEQVYWLSETGIIKNVLMKYYAGNAQGLVAYHKAFVLSGLVFIKLFGFSLYVLKSVSLFYLIIFLVISYHYFVKVRKLVKWPGFLLISGIFLINPLVFEYSFVYRPEIMLMTSGFLAFIFMEQSIRHPKTKYLYVLMSSLFCGLSLLTHLNGIIFTIAGGVVLLYRKEFKSLIIFTFISIIGLYIYFYHIMSFEGLAKWYYAVSGYESGQITSGDDQNIIWKFIMNLINEQKRYLHSPKEISFTMLVVFSMVAGYKQIKRRTPLVLPYLLVLVISLGFFAINKTTKYLIIFMPYFMMIIIVTTRYFIKLKEKSSLEIIKNGKPLYLTILLVLYIITSLVYDCIICSNKNDSNNIIQIREDLIKKDVSNKVLLAPMHFIFTEMDEYKEIRGLMSFNERSKSNSEIMGKGFFKVAYSEGIDYIVLDKIYIDKFNLDCIVEADSNKYFRYLGQEGRYFTLEKIN